MKKQEYRIEPIVIPEKIFPYTLKDEKKLGLDGNWVDEQNREAFFPNEIKIRRKQLGLSQQEVADYLGLTKSTIGFYETGDNIPDIKSLYKLSKLLKVSADYLLKLSDIENPDLKVKGVHDFTGLSEAAIILLNNMNLKNSIVVSVISNLLTNEKFLVAIKLLERLDNEKHIYQDYSENFERALSDMQSELAELIFRKPEDDLYSFEVGKLGIETGKRNVSLPLFIEFLRQTVIRVFSDVIYDLTGKDTFMNYFDILQGLYLDDHFGGEKHSARKEE